MNKEVKAKIDASILRYAEKIPRKYRGLFLRCIRREVSPRQMIKAMCHSCVGYHHVEEGISDCRGFICPLWSERPYQKDEQSQ